MRAFAAKVELLGSDGAHVRFVHSALAQSLVERGIDPRQTDTWQSDPIFYLQHQGDVQAAMESLSGAKREARLGGEPR